MNGSLYAARTKIQPQAVRGTFRRIKWVLLAVTLGVYYAVPFFRWDRGPSQPSQAVLLDLDRGRFHFFSIELWPQDVTYVMGLLILAALILFLMNASRAGSGAATSALRPSGPTCSSPSSA